MRGLANTIGGILRPLAVGLLVLIGLALLSSDDKLGSGPTSCPRITDDPGLNRTLCRFSPARIWNRPVADLIPWSGPTDRS